VTSLVGDRVMGLAEGAALAGLWVVGTAVRTVGVKVEGEAVGVVLGVELGPTVV
jgi:hypothetical protein